MTFHHIFLSLVLLVMATMRVEVVRAAPEGAVEQLEEVVEESAPTPEEQLRQQAEDNTNALKKLAEVMNNLVYESSNQRCLGTGSNTQTLTASIREGFSILVGAVQDVNSTLRHFKDELNHKSFSESTASAFEDDGPCPSPFFLAGEDCLYIETEHLRYFDAARQACLDMGAKLAEFESFEPFLNAVSQMDIHEDAEIFIGGSDIESEGTWKWLSGERMRNIPWGYSEPNNLPREDCIALRPSWKKFNDIRCTLRREFVCKWER